MDYTNKTLKELIDLCSEKNLSKSGNKPKLIERLTKSLSPSPSSTPSNEIVSAKTQNVISMKICEEMWSLICPIAQTEGPKLFLGRILLKKEHGNRPGGMGTSSIEEDLWTSAFRRAGILGESTCTQADCGIRCSINSPLSIKCTATAMAVNWGKNKTKIKFVFVAPILIIYHRPEKPSKSRKELNSGAYLVDPEWCNEHIVLTSNNKSDYVITDATATEMLLRAKTMNFYHEIKALPDN